MVTLKGRKRIEAKHSRKGCENPWCHVCPSIKKVHLSNTFHKGEESGHGTRARGSGHGNIADQTRSRAMSLLDSQDGAPVHHHSQPSQNTASQRSDAEATKIPFQLSFPTNDHAMQALRTWAESMSERLAFLCQSYTCLPSKKDFFMHSHPM